MSNIKPHFEKLLGTFVKSTQQSMSAARELATISIEQFAEHGDLSYAQTFLEAMPKNYIRRVAFLKWLADHSPVTMDRTTGKLIKDKSPEAVEFNLDGAKATPFWDYAPDPEQINFGADDVVVALRRAVDKFRNGKRYHAASEKAQVTLEKADQLIDTLANGTDDVKADSGVEARGIAA